MNTHGNPWGPLQERTGGTLGVPGFTLAKGVGSPGSMELAWRWDGFVCFCWMGA